MRRREAAKWLARLQSARDPDIERKFRRWREADPANAEAFERVRRSYEQAGLLRQSDTVESSTAVPSHPPAARSPRYALAAVLAGVVIIPTGTLLVLGGSPLFARNLILSTRIGEIREVGLSDGSKVTLDTDSRVEVELARSNRRARVTRGRARFQITAANVPFVIEAGKTVVTSSGGTLDVDQTTNPGRVAVMAGSAQVQSSRLTDQQDVALGAGDALEASGGLVPRRNALSQPDWTRGILQFDQTPLVDAVEIANRYSRRPIVLHDDLGALRVTGAYRAGDTIGLAKALAAAFNLSLQSDGDGKLVLSPAAARDRGNKKGG